MRLAYQVMENNAGEILIMVDAIPGSPRFELVGNTISVMRGRKLWASIEALNEESLSKIKTFGGTILEFYGDAMPYRTSQVKVI